MRNVFTYEVTLQGDDGSVIEFAIHTFWSPARDYVLEHASDCAKAMAWYAGGKAVRYAPIGARLR